MILPVSISSHPTREQKSSVYSQLDPLAAWSYDPSFPMRLWMLLWVTAAVAGLIIHKMKAPRYLRVTVDGTAYYALQHASTQEVVQVLTELRTRALAIATAASSGAAGERPAVRRLRERLQTCAFSETAVGAGHTLSKGRQIALCVRAKDGNVRSVRDPSLLHVLIHELAHVMTYSKGHTDEFWNNVRTLQVAARATPEGYVPLRGTVTMCGDIVRGFS
jgi:hypothetical protein